MSIYIVIYKVTRSAGGLAEFSVKEKKRKKIVIIIIIIIIY